MMKSRMVLVLGIVIVGALTVNAQQPDSAKQAELMAKAMELAQPGPEHQRLVDMVGKWTMEVKSYPAPGQPPMTATTTGETMMVLGGRFLKMTSSGEMFGMTFESFNMLGFDRRKGEYTWVGFDSFGTYYVTAAGKYDEATKTITMSGTDDDPVLGHKQVYDVVITFVDPDTHVTKIIFKNPEVTQGKGDFTMVEVTSRRQK